MWWSNEIECMFERLNSLAADREARREVQEIKDAIYAAQHSVSKTHIGLTSLLSASGPRPSGIPVAMRRSIDTTTQKVRAALIEAPPPPPGSPRSSVFSQSDKARIFDMLSGALSVVRELYDTTALARQIAGTDYWTTWAEMETRFALDEVEELLRSTAYSTPQRGPAYPYRPIQTAAGIRLLVIQPAADPESAIRCSLIQEADRTKRGYAALSYCWGSFPDSPPAILLDGVDFKVTPNLHAALKQFRHSSRRRVLWVDAVCINQADDAEKSQQVAQMHEIYRCSACILMWIGDASSQGSFAIQWLRELQEARLEEGLDAACHSDTVRNHWPAIRDFFEQPYWRRVWILQEAICRDDSLVCFGARGIPWGAVRHLALTRLPDIQEAIMFKVGSGRRQDQQEVALEIEICFRRIKLHADFTEKRVRGARIPFLDGLVATRNCDATDARDRIYAVMGFVSSDCPANVDYSKPLWQVYLETARDVIRRTGKLEVLTLCKDWAPDRSERQATSTYGCSNAAVRALMRRVLPSRPPLEPMTLADVRRLLVVARYAQSSLPADQDESHRKTMIDLLDKMGAACLPSWVPRWHWKTTEAYLLFDEKHPQAFNAAGGTAASYNFGNGDAELSLRGVRVDVVQRVVEFRNVVIGAAKAPWDAWAEHSLRSPRYPATESRQDAFVRTCMRLSTAHRQRGEGWPTGGRAMLQRRLFEMEMGWADFSTVYIDAAQAVQDDPGEAMEYSDRLQQSLRGQVFLICADGHIGLGPATARSGDLVCILNGGDVPFLLRAAVGVRYYLMGEVCKCLHPQQSVPSSHARDLQYH
jgi:hypothetical protein